MEQTRIHAAYHEAGHYVAHRHLMPNSGTIAVSIVPDEGAAHSRLYGLEGRFRKLTAAEAESLGIPPDDGYIEELATADIESEIVILYAGAAAELRLDPSRAEAVRLGARGDSRQAAGLLGDGIPDEYPGLRQPEREAALRQRAADLVVKHWREIEAIAGELLEHETLDDREAELVADAAAGDPGARASLERYRMLRPPPKAG